MKVAFLHPDLGIGGAERLVVDAALGLQRLGHTVHIYTSHHNVNHCFEETRDGTLTVKYVQPPFPRSLHGKGHVLFAHLRQLHLTLHLFLSGQSSAYDVYFVDQLPTCIPFLREVAHKRVVFYGHFPDKLLADGQFIENQTGPKKLSLKGLYRKPMDWLEEATLRQTDILLVNSKFTGRVFAAHFTTIRQSLRVVYPGINTQAYDEPVDHNDKSVDHQLFNSHRPTLVSLNRFEKKKNAALAIKAFALARTKLTSQDKDRGLDALRLVLAGGYDPRLRDNIDTLTHLTDLCREHSLKYSVIPPVQPASESPTIMEPDVILLLNFTQVQRTWLLKSPFTQALLYTPTNEHFGIGPVEGMVSRLPVLACDSGGPTESVVDPNISQKPMGERTGWLRPPEPNAWSEAILEILRLSVDERCILGQCARQRALMKFSLDAMAKSIEEALQEAVNLGNVQGKLTYWFTCVLSVSLVLVVIAFSPHLF